MLLLALMQGFALLVVILRLMPGRHRAAPVAPSEGEATPGVVSIVVPTFNEATRIAPCMEGLLQQSAVVREILFVDSGSTDGTQELIAAAAAVDPRVRLLRDDPLPAGWVGKVWALQHGLAHASGEWVLGIDADTQPHAGLAGGVLEAAREGALDVVSFSPRFLIESAGERLLQPALLVTLVYRFGAAGTNVSPDRLMANGQCFLAKRSVLSAEGGYTAAMSSFSDDVTLARHLAERGHRVAFLDGSRLYDVRSYSSASQTWREWGRSLDLKDSSTWWRQVGDVALLLVAQGTPLASLIWVSVTGRLAHPLAATSIALLAIRIAMGFALAGSYAERGAAFWLSPLADPLAALRILLSSVRRPTSWRGRAFVAQDPVSQGT